MTEDEYRLTGEIVILKEVGWIIDKLDKIK